LWLLNFVILQICKMLQKSMLPFPIDYFKGTNFQVLNFANLRSTTKFNTRKNHIDCKISQRLQNFNTGKSFQEKMEKYCSFMFLSNKHFFFWKVLSFLTCFSQNWATFQIISSFTILVFYSQIASFQ